MKLFLIRLARFNLVGIFGTAVQLGSLAVLNHLAPAHYLVMSAIALELSLLHNFVWHLHYTWRDRRATLSPARQLLRFHLANGLVSLLGNLVLMHVLVRTAHLPVVLANFVAILACSGANFVLGHRWAFAPTPGNAAVQPRRLSLLTIAMLAITARPLHSQTPQNETTQKLPDAPSTQPFLHHEAQTAADKQSQVPTAPTNSAFDYFGSAAVFCGTGASTSSVSTRPTIGCGASFAFFTLWTEVGMMVPQANRSYLTGYLSVDEIFPIHHVSANAILAGIVGYSRLFETGHSADYGVALSLPRYRDGRDNDRTYRIELRDYWTFANPSQHNIMMRVGWVIGLPD